jgi:hypothetical protein
LELGVNGNIDCNWTNTHLKGSCAARLEAEEGGSYLAVILKQNNLVNKYWYDRNSGVCFLSRFHAETSV